MSDLRRTETEVLRPGPAAGLTVVEVLAVIAVMTTLAAIAWPVLVGLRAMGRQARCMSNLRQLGSAFLLYVQDYDGRLPGSGIVPWVGPTDGGHWVPWGPVWRPHPLPVEAGALYPYVRSTGPYTCPSDPESGWARVSYSMNNALSFKALSALLHPASTVLLVHASGEPRWSSYGIGPSVLSEAPQRLLTPYFAPRTPVPCWPSPPVCVEEGRICVGGLGCFHQKGTVNLWADGHVNWAPEGGTTVGMLDP